MHGYDNSVSGTHPEFVKVRDQSLFTLADEKPFSSIDKMPIKSKFNCK